MGDIVVIGLVVAVSVAAHVWLFSWVKFKIDESVILKCLEETSESGVLCSKDISAHTNIRSKRVTAVCRKSRGVHGSAHTEDAWCIIRE